ncbi:MAG: N-acetylmuramoyl-L-alanine amidase [Candidatus Krumholzibacteria bacterium]|jgi:N-acetyl-anhydromuramyl-L-alanine amidase AmpD|nr:N-acetylmuramoyl-L-alanine amidase [Candidatus Krumholzibacteria bacterium]MDP6797908.1 N-acetylmuramoyl-L-alanine amidase [Candidatus Krumholzibacteria bacterium]
MKPRLLSVLLVLAVSVPGLSLPVDSLLQVVAGRLDPAEHNHGNDVEVWRSFLSRPPLNLQTLRSYFVEAAEEFSVPRDLLEAIGQVENNWLQIGPSIDQGWGIMHLTDNHYSRTLEEAAGILGLDPELLRQEARENIRGAAALLSRFGEESGAGEELSSWFSAAARFSGLSGQALQEMQARRYFEVLREGSRSRTVWGETLVLPPHPGLSIPEPAFLGRRSVDYPPAIEYLTPCNHQDGRNHEIDTWVNHWIGVGTYAGAISWFHNCNAQVSAHFVIRCSDGEITQIVLIEDTGWHCGAYGYPYNNSRSIGVEHEATVSNPENWNSEPMLQASSLMANYFCQMLDIPMQRSLPGVQGHNDMPGTATQCPGTLPWDHWLELLNSPVYAGSAPESPLRLSVYPNPFNPKTRIDFSLEEAGSVSLKVFDPSGRLMATLREGLLSAGSHSLEWTAEDNEGRALSSGLYLLHLEVEGKIDTRKLLLGK